MSKLLTPADLAELLRVSTGHVYRLVAQRRVPFIRFGGSVRFRSDSIELWIQRQEIVSVAQVLGRGKRTWTVLTQEGDKT